MIFFKGVFLMDEIIINVFNIVGNNFCVDTDDGQKVFDLIKKALQEEKKVKLSFQNVEMVTSAFLNTAIGQLYRDFKEDKIKNSLSVEQILPEDSALLKRVVRTAKLYYKNPERMKDSIKEILGE
jgi:Icc-related predicted phosphoesterase